MSFEPIKSIAIREYHKGFAFVAPLVEPWFAPDWLSLDEIITDLSNRKVSSDYDRFHKRFWLDFYINRKKDVERCPEILYADKRLEK